ncbi:MAG TPA: glycosyltransferase family 4 protein [Anaerolineales bacterium]|nr:glycosyltransferase family 4 protein [Anaerolineales bacterium]
MMSRPAHRICLVNPSRGVAGPASFQRRLAAGLAARGIGVAYGLDDEPYAAALVVGGIRQLAGLARARRGGVPVLQRLDGINWLHRRLPTGLRHYLRAEANNLLMRFVRRRLADLVVYQSQFAREWWTREFGEAPVRSLVVHNGVPLDQFSPDGEGRPPADRIRLLMVEGRLGGGYEIGLGAAASLAQRLQAMTGSTVELAVAGEVTERARSEPQARFASRSSSTGPAALQLNWLGKVEPDSIPALDRTGHLLYAADLNPACPNTVLEAMACGLPVVAFATGALPELVQGHAGRLAPYGGDPWKLETPDIEGLVQAAAEVLAEQDRYRRGARARAEQAFGQERMVQGYLDALGWA